ncbi:branched-chain amino acid ABC transporter permease [Hydrogenophaga sp. YM1]|uniref:branched-chain amino acid ABC transporter permease n=1 Tax=Hydrogenophaga sp. YM1 TaxID=2806262 RepID=UPI00195A6BA0|nr:branched-chain amino acid ABC transporter permease [Hydrogenophaga sp. YM1]QRR33980.1 branched-chain amino acid ABC transporter permease [Hydrogenophaga sp. YM1]
MEAFIDHFLASLPNGGIYASVALALVVIYQATHHINFAQGEMAVFSTYVAWMLIEAGLGYWAAFALTLALSFALGMAIQYFVLRPLNNAPKLSIVVTSIGLLMIFHGLAGWVFGHTLKAFPSPFPSDAWYGSPNMSAHAVGAVFVTMVAVVVLFLFFRLTKVGLAIRAAAYNPDSASLVGISVGAMLMLGWGLAAALGAVAGMMAAPVVYLSPEMMGGVLLYAFAGAVLGGISSPIGAVVGGMLVGIVESLASVYLVGTEFKLTVALVIIVGVLLVRPWGLFGKPVVRRV